MDVVSVQTLRRSPIVSGCAPRSKRFQRVARIVPSLRNRSREVPLDATPGAGCGEQGCPDCALRAALGRRSARAGR